jgi:hypothetical protein
MSWLSRIFSKRKPADPPASGSSEPEAYVRLDFIRTFPHIFWISSVSYDQEAPNGFRYKMFTVRHEPGMNVELILLRERDDGIKRVLAHMQGSMEKFGTTQDIIRELQSSANVEFEQFDLSSIRTFDDFRIHAIEVGWETAHNE